MAREVLTYLKDRPDAQDTLEGIARWWLLERDVEREVTKVEEALRQLADADLLEIHETVAHSARYALNRERFEQVRDLLASPTGEEKA